MQARKAAVTSNASAGDERDRELVVHREHRIDQGVRRPQREKGPDPDAGEHAHTRIMEHNAHDLSRPRAERGPDRELAYPRPVRRDSECDPRKIERSNRRLRLYRRIIDVSPAYAWLRFGRMAWSVKCSHIRFGLHASRQPRAGRKSASLIARDAESGTAAWRLTPRPNPLGKGPRPAPVPTVFVAVSHGTCRR